MTVRNLEHCFRPRSVAVVGASGEAGSVGYTLNQNILKSEFQGSVYLVNPHHAKVDGYQCFKSVADLPEAPELAVIATPPSTVPTLIGELGEKGTRAAVVVTAGLSPALNQAMLDKSRPYCLRIIGPNCLGVSVPEIGLNANFGLNHPKPGKLAFLSQSGALMTGILDWASARDIGFSYVVSMGDMADVDVGGLLDFLAADVSTSAILLYLETIPAARKFMSAARSAARAKPAIAIKSGRNADGRRLATASERIVVRGCRMRAGHGGVTIGSEVSGSVRDVFVEGNVMSSPELERGIRFKTNAVRGGTIENVFVRDVEIGETGSAIDVDMLYEEGAAGGFLPVVRNILIERLSVRSARYAFFIRGLPSSPVRNVEVRQSVLRGVSRGSRMEHVDELVLRNVVIEPSKQPANQEEAR